MGRGAQRWRWGTWLTDRLETSGSSASSMPRTEAEKLQLKDRLETSGSSASPIRRSSPAGIKSAGRHRARSWVISGVPAEGSSRRRPGTTCCPAEPPFGAALLVEHDPPVQHPTRQPHHERPRQRDTWWHGLRRGGGPASDVVAGGSCAQAARGKDVSWPLVAHLCVEVGEWHMRRSQAAGRSTLNQLRGVLGAPKNHGGMRVQAQAERQDRPPAGSAEYEPVPPVLMQCQ